MCVCVYYSRNVIFLIFSVLRRRKEPFCSRRKIPTSPIDVMVHNLERDNKRNFSNCIKMRIHFLHVNFNEFQRNVTRLNAASLFKTYGKRIEENKKQNGERDCDTIFILGDRSHSKTHFLYGSRVKQYPNFLHQYL